MSTVELKSHIIKLVEDSKNEELLETLLEIVRKKGSSSDDMWEDLTSAQKQEVLNSYEESENDENLVDKNKLFRYLK